MSKIKQLLRLYQEGYSNRRIANELGIYKNTVNEYVKKIKLHEFNINQLLELEDPLLEGMFMSGSQAYKDSRFEEFKTLIPYFEKELKRKHVTRVLLWKEYLEKYPSGYRYTQFCQNLNQLLLARKPSAILEHSPGEKLFVDFAGDQLEYVDRYTGEVCKCCVFVATLPFSDYAFIYAVPSQSTDDFLYALSRCLEDLGGSPKILVPDNLKAAVIKADKYEPELNRVMEDFANHYGFVVIPARARKPKDKALVENQVKLIYQRVYAKIRNQTFFSLSDLNEALMEKTRLHNQTRMQQKEYSREEKFLADEKDLLKKLPSSAFEIKHYASLRVATNNCIYLGRDKHYYSVPHTYIGQKVEIIYTRSLVKVYCKSKLIATHSRSSSFGYTLNKDHLCSTHRHYKDRSPDYYIQKAKSCSSHLALFFERMFVKEEIPEVLFKRCDGLLNLQRKSDPEIFEEACRVALENGILTYKFVKNRIENRMTYNEETSKTMTKKLPQHKNIRGSNYYY